MNLILEHSKFVKYYTFLDPIFDAAPELAEFEYLISDIELAGEFDDRLLDPVIVIAGAKLREILTERKVQFVWAVFSAFDKVSTIPSELPYADGNPTFWVGSPRPQVQNARFEIVCWDSSATLFIGVEPSLATKIRARFPDVRDLDAFNRKTDPAS